MSTMKRILLVELIVFVVVTLVMLAIFWPRPAHGEMLQTAAMAHRRCGKICQLSEPAPQPVMKRPDPKWVDKRLTRMLDNELGVVCYQRDPAGTMANGLDFPIFCVKYR
jgi:hypothetical protein